MDGQKFDKLTRAFAAGTDRRTLLKIFGGATVAGVAGLTVARPSWFLPKARFNRVAHARLTQIAHRAAATPLS